MLRTFAVELALFVTPFVLYAVVLLLTRGSLVPAHWSPLSLALLSVAAIALMAGGLVMFESGRSAAPGSRYVPAQTKDGEFVPGHFE